MNKFSALILSLLASCVMQSAVAAGEPGNDKAPQHPALATTPPAMPQGGPPPPTEDTPIARGAALFQYYCVRCHGAAGEGDGRAAKLYDPKPANLTQSRGSVRALEKMIREGGESNGISQFMPPLGEELSEQQIQDLAAFVISLRKRN